VEVSIPGHILIENGIFETDKTLREENTPENDEGENDRKSQPDKYSHLIAFQRRAESSHESVYFP